ERELPARTSLRRGRYLPRRPPRHTSSSHAGAGERPGLNRGSNFPRMGQFQGYIPPMPLHDFHPAVSRWFRDRLGEPTAAQRRGWEAIRAGRDTLIAAPTGSGKTLAAFLISIDQLLRESLDGTLPQETRVVYVSPLKALSADIHRNLAEP